MTRHSSLILLTSVVASLLGTSSEIKSLPALAFHPCPPFHRAEHSGPFGTIPVCVPELPPGNIPTNPREASEEAWGQAGVAIYRQGGEALLARASARGSAPRRLDNFQKQYLRPHFGSLVDNVVVFYNVPPLDNWEILGVRIANSHTDAQTFCERIFMKNQYKSGDKEQLITLGHELVHSQQCQKYGSSENFGYEYFKAYKKANLNYDNISLEREAYGFQKRFAEWQNGRFIRNGLSGKCIDVSGSPGNANRAKLQLWDCETSLVGQNNSPTDQKWIFQDGFIRNGLSGKCIDVAGSPGNANRDLLQLWDCETSGRGLNNSLTDQKWDMTSDGLIRNRLSGKCIDVSGSPGNANNAPLQLWDCETSGHGLNNSPTDQRWRLE